MIIHKRQKSGCISKLDGHVDLSNEGIPRFTDLNCYLKPPPRHDHDHDPHQGEALTAIKCHEVP